MAEYFRGSLDDYSEAVAKMKVQFDYANERVAFDRMFSVLADKFGDEAFLKHKGKRALGGLAPAYFDAVTMGLIPLIDRLEKTSPRKAKEILNLAVGHENAAFRANVGPGANAVPRLHKRIEQVRTIFDTKLPK